MAYNYNDFLKKATEAGMLGEYSADELALAQQSPEYGLSTLKLRQNLRKATTPQQKALAGTAMEKIQSSYGPKLEKLGKPFEWGGEKEYNEALDKVVNRPAFSYDPTKDEGLSAYRKMMLREGDRAVQNTLAQTSAMTGGIPSSWAVSAANQQGNYHASQIADAMPNFRAQALQGYLQQGQADLQALQALGGEREFAYNQYLQQVKQAQQLWASGQRSKELADILGIPWEEPKPAGGGRRPNPGNPDRGYGDSDVMNAYIQLKQAGANTRELDAMLKQEIQKGTISQKDASEIRSAGYGGQKFLEGHGFIVR